MGGFGRGGANFRTGRKISAPDLQLLILALLAEGPRHGYELIKLIEKRSGGFYVPSPGVIYPALTYLEEIGYASCEAESIRKLYSITEAGRKHFHENRTAVDTMLAELERIGAKMERLRRVFSGDELSGDMDDDVDPRGRSDLHQARHQLRMALRQKRHASPTEIQRVAEILKRAAEEIQGESE